MDEATNTPIPEIEMEPTSAKHSWRTWVAVAAAAVVVGAAAIFGLNAASSSDSSNATTSDQGTAANAAEGSGGTQDAAGQPGGLTARPGGFGTIAEIDASTLTIEDESGASTKVLTSDSTTVTTAEVGTADDIKVGDTVTVIGTGSTTEIAATRVTNDGTASTDAGGPGGPGGMAGAPPGAGTGQRPDGAGRGNLMPGGQPPGAAGDMAMTRGVVQSVGDGTFNVEGMDGTSVKVTTSSSTTVSIAKNATVSDLEVGDQIVVIGSQADGTITATSIRQGAGGGFPGGFRGAPPAADAATGTET
jgi:hypothetical protein